MAGKSILFQVNWIIIDLIYRYARSISDIQLIFPPRKDPIGSKGAYISRYILQYSL